MLNPDKIQRILITCLMSTTHKEGFSPLISLPVIMRIVAEGVGEGRKGEPGDGEGQRRDRSREGRAGRGEELGMGLCDLSVEGRNVENFCRVRLLY